MRVLIRNDDGMSSLALFPSQAENASPILVAQIVRKFTVLFTAERAAC